MPAVRARGLVKRFETTVAVDHLDLDLQAGEIRGLLGPNGAGKTTLLRLLFGLIRADEGSIELFGRSFTASDTLHLDGVAGFVEDPAFYPYLSARVNLELLAELDGERAAARIGAVLDEVGLTERAEDRLGGFSTGMRQRLGIAGALLREPRLLLLDEPTSGLDPAGARDMATLVRRLAADGVAVLLSSHQIGEIEEICHSFTVVRHGAVVWNGTAAKLRAQAPGSAYALVTSDDAAALAIAQESAGVRCSRTRRGELAITVEPGQLDAYVLSLGAAGVAVRRLELLVSPLASMFFALTSDVALDPAALHEQTERVLSGT